MVDYEGRIVMRLEQARVHRGISVAELSRRIGVDRKRLWRVLNGQRAMRVDEFVKLCAFFGLGSSRSSRKPERRGGLQSALRGSEPPPKARGLFRVHRSTE